MNRQPATDGRLRAMVAQIRADLGTEDDDGCEAILDGMVAGVYRLPLADRDRMIAMQHQAMEEARRG